MPTSRLVHFLIVLMLALLAAGPAMACAAEPADESATQADGVDASPDPEADPAADPEADPEPDPQADPQPEADPEADDSALAGDAELVLYSGRSQELVEPLLELFEEESGIDVQVRWGSTSEVATALLEEGEHSPADVFYAQDPGGLGAVSGLLAPLPDELLSQVDPRFVSDDGLWVGLSGRVRTVVYNTEELSPEDLPDDITGFAEPEWEGRIGWAPTNASFQTMVTAMRIVWGEDATKEWLEGILANDPVVYEGNTPVVAAVGAGEVDVGFVNHYYLYRFLEEEGESFPARNYFFPTEGPGSLVMVSGAGIVEGAEHEEAAMAFLEFMLSNEAQTYFAEETFEYPLVPEVEAAAFLDPLTDIQSPAVDLSRLDDIQGTVAVLREVGALP